VNEVQTLRTRRNEVVAAVQAKVTAKTSGKDANAAAIAAAAAAATTASLPADLAAADMPALVAEGKELKIVIAAKEAVLTTTEAELERLAFKLPNMIHPAAPFGAEVNATTLAHHNKGRASLGDFLDVRGFVPKDHLDLAREHGLVDLESAAKVTGSRFYYLLREAALLELALINYTVQKLVAKGFTPVLPPDLARSAVVEGAGFQSKDERSLAHHVYQVRHITIYDTKHEIY